MEDCLILLSDRKISSLNDMIPLLEQVVKAGKPLLVVAEDIEGEALATLIVNQIRGILKSCAVKAPGFGDRRKDMLQDMAVLTGGQIISEELGLKLEHATLRTAWPLQARRRRQGQYHDYRRGGRTQADRWPHRANPPGNRKGDQRLRQGKAAGASGETGRRRRRDPRRRAFGIGDEIEEGSLRRRDQRDQSRGRRRDRAWRRFGVAALRRRRRAGRSQMRRRREDGRADHQARSGSTDASNRRELGNRRRSGSRPDARGKG